MSSVKPKLPPVIVAVIGAREAPHEVCQFTAHFVRRLAADDTYDFYFRGGGAKGMDDAGMYGGGLRHVLYLPKPGHRGLQSKYDTPTPEAYEVASRFHPAWNRLEPFHQALMARNVHVILGQSLNKPCNIVLCWTEDGCEHASTRTSRTGGTGHAIAVASAWNIPIVNIKRHGLDADEVYRQLLALAGLLPM